MISIIVSSYKQDLFNQLSVNIQQTIGDIPYEIIRIWNPAVMSICEAYNEGGSKANYPYLVFAHEDILFHTPKWGNLLVQAFESDAAIGLLGVAGSFYKALFYSGWPIDSSISSAFMIGTHYGISNLKKVKHGVDDTEVLGDDKTIPQRFIEPGITNEEVMVLDGMLLATRKEVFADIKFDNNTFTHFHCYDLDYSMQVSQKYKVVVNQNILIEHLSAGSFAGEWITGTKAFTRKWMNVLPASDKAFSNKSKAMLEWKACEQYLRMNKQNTKEMIKGILFLYSPAYIKRMGTGCWLSIQYNLWRKLAGRQTHVKPASVFLQ